jgi:hypothetical protein
MSTKNLPGGRRRPVREAENHTTICVCRVYRKCGNLDDPQPYGSPRSIIGIALLLLLLRPMPYISCACVTTNLIAGVSWLHVLCCGACVKPYWKLFRQRLFSLLQALGVTQLHVQRLRGFLSQGIKRSGRGAHHSPPSNSEVKYEWSCYPLPLTHSLGSTQPFKGYHLSCK